MTEDRVLRAIEGYNRLCEIASEAAAVVATTRWGERYAWEAKNTTYELVEANASTVVMRYHDRGEAEYLQFPTEYLWLTEHQIRDVELATIAEKNRIAREHQAAKDAKAKADQQARDKAMYERLKARAKVEGW